MRKARMSDTKYIEEILTPEQRLKFTVFVKTWGKANLSPGQKNMLSFYDVYFE